MKNLEIYIDGTRLNFIDREGFPLSLSLSIDAAENPSKIVGSYSKRTINFPGDGETGEFFQEWADSTRINPDAASRRPCRIDVNGITVFTGVAQLEDVTTSGSHGLRRVSGHRVSVLGNNATWFSDMKAALVRDMGMIPLHDLTADYVSTHDNADPDLDTFGYFLARTKDWSVENNVQYTEFTPFVFIRPMLVEAFRRVGYSFSSAFFDTDLGKRLILPVPFRPYSESDVTEWRAYVSDNNNGTVLNPADGTLGDTGITHITVRGDNINNNDGGYYDTGTGYYTAPMSGYYIFAVPAVGPPLTVFLIRINGVTVIDQFTDPFNGDIGLQGRVFLEAGDTVELLAVTLDVAPDPVELAFLYATPDLNAFEEGTTIDLSKYGNPDWALSDVVSGVTHAFGLVWNTDPDGYTVAAEPRDSYLLRKKSPFLDYGGDGFFKRTDRVDMTEKVDISKEATVANVLSDSKYTLAWKTDGADGNLSVIDSDSAGPLKLYDAAYNFPQGRFQPGENKFENPFFSKTLHVFDAEIKHSSSPFTPQLPVLQSDTFGTPQDTIGDFEPRVLYFAGRRDGLDGFVNLGSGVSYDYPAAFMVNYNDDNGYDPSLSFCSETLLNGEIVAGLMQRLHMQFLKRIEVGKQLTEWLHLTELDIANLEFRKKILLGDAIYLIKKVNGYNPLSNRSTEIALIADAVPATEDPQKIAGASTRGYIAINQ